MSSGILINSDKTIDGQGHSIYGKNKARAFNITSGNVVFKNITFANCQAEDCGGAIIAENVNLTFINVN